MVGKELLEDVEQEGHEVFDRGFDADNVVGVEVFLAVGKDERVAVTGADFGESAEGFVVEPVVDDVENLEVGVVDEGDGAVFELATGVSFGVDIGDFFELEGAFEGNGISSVTTKVEGVVVFGVFFGEFFDGGSVGL